MGDEFYKFCTGETDQKLFGEYRFATSRMTSAESFSIGYTPYEELG